eukprot:TRINITY_DN85972_c0_g1_i1.p3 TRINITY_DN85972_c0_g1~~TRINITY_DN85972_c0_g1_i1.p3  ORF type:complete len:106 (-),score=10.41 TRINITY_DN85972_c0_g1_i1:82-399(-)
MKIRNVFSVVLGVSTLLLVGCASTGVEESNSAVVSVEDVSGSGAESPPHLESNFNPSNNPIPRGYDGRPVGTLTPQEKLRRSRQQFSSFGTIITPAVQDARGLLF